MRKTNSIKDKDQDKLRATDPGEYSRNARNIRNLFLKF